MANRSRDWFAQSERDLAHASHDARDGVLAIGCFGSYARRDHGPGSDLDLIATVETSGRSFIDRAGAWGVAGIQAEGGRFARTIAAETVWMHGGDTLESGRTAPMAV